LEPILTDTRATVRSHILIEDDLPSEVAAFAPIPAKTRTVIGDDGTKYTRHSSREEQLFDLVADPNEMRPLHQHGGERRAQAVELLADALIEADDVARGAPVRPPRK
jgi:hypothetical protein